MEPIFQKGDYIINRDAGDIGIVKSVSKKNYYQFSEFYGGMFDELKDLSIYPYELQVNYQKFFDLCTEEERGRMDSIIAKTRSKKD